MIDITEKNTPFHKHNNLWREKNQQIASSAPVEFHFIFTIYMDHICITLVHGY